MERLPGTPYLAGDVMGRGPHGAVLAGRDALDRPLAVKVLSPELSGDPATAADFAGQRDTLLSVRHPHLVPVYDVLSADSGVLAIVTERADGGNLRQALEVVRTFPPSEACRLGAQLARALAAVHSAGLVHGDLVATNVLFNDAGSRPAVRVSDVGLTRWLASLGRGWVPAGAYAYAAPEAAAGGVPGPPADLYSLGVLLHEMCVGVPPFQGDPAEVMHRHVEEVPVRPAGIPDQLWVLIAALLAKDGAARVGPAAAVAGYLDAIAADVDRVPPAAPLGPMAAAAAVAPLPDLAAPAAAAAEPFDPQTAETDVLPVVPVAGALAAGALAADALAADAVAAEGPAAHEAPAWTPPPAAPAPWERPAMEGAAYEAGSYEPYAAAGYEPAGFEPVGYEPVEAVEPPREERVMAAAYVASYNRRRRQRAAAIAAAVLVPLIALAFVISRIAGGDGGDGVQQNPVVLPTPVVLPGDLGTPTPSPLPTVSALPSASATPTPTPTPSGPNPTPAPTPTPAPPKPTPTPAPPPTPTPVPPPPPTPTPVPTPTPTPTPTPPATPPPTTPP